MYGQLNNKVRPENYLICKLLKFFKTGKLHLELFEIVIK